MTDFEVNQTMKFGFSKQMIAAKRVTSWGWGRQMGGGRRQEREGHDNNNGGGEGKVIF